MTEIEQRALRMINSYKEEAARIFGLPLEDVTPGQRALAKAWRFAEMYGRQIRSSDIPKKVNHDRA